MVKAQIFTSPFCPHCKPAVNFLKEIQKEKEFEIEEVSIGTPEGNYRAREAGVMTVPTLFITGSAISDRIGFRNFPMKDDLLKAIDVADGKADLEKPKGLFSKLKKLFK